MQKRIFEHDKVLVVMSHVKLGDFLLLTPHLQRLKQLYPNLHVQVPGLLSELYEECDLLTEGKNSQKPFLHTVNLSYPLLAGIDIPDNHIKLNKKYFTKPQHVFVSYGEALREIFPAYVRFPDKAQAFMERDFFSTTLERHQLKAFSYFTVHSGSDFWPKNWSPGNFEKTIESVLKINSHLKCVSLVGPQDDELFTNKTAPANFMTLKVSLREVAHVLSGALFHIDNDSGVHHLAGVLNVPSISVFGPTGPGTWSSAAEMNFVHWGGPSCKHHCGGSESAACGDRVCLNSVKPEALLASAETILRNYV